LPTVGRRPLPHEEKYYAYSTIKGPPDKGPRVPGGSSPPQGPQPFRSPVNTRLFLTLFPLFGGIPLKQTQFAKLFCQTFRNWPDGTKHSRAVETPSGEGPKRLKNRLGLCREQPGRATSEGNVPRQVQRTLPRNLVGKRREVIFFSQFLRRAVVRFG